jgi:hypothetical protein
LVEITKTGPLEKLVWALIKDPDNEIKTIHNRTEEATEEGSGSTRPTASFRQNLDSLFKKADQSHGCSVCVIEV